MTAASRLTRRVPALAYAEFRRFWGGAVISNSGSMMYLAALGWITTDVTDSAAAIAAVPFIGLVPLFLVSPFAGAWADRLNRKRMLIFAIAGQAMVGAGVAIMVTADAVTYPRLVVASIVGGVFGSLGAPVFQALIPSLVPVPALRSAVIMNSLQFNISRAVGPTAAGLLIDGVGAAFVFWLNVATFAAVLVAITTLDDRPPAFDGATDRSVFGDIAAGTRYAARTPSIRVALIAGTIIAVLIFPISYVAPILATQGLDLEASEFGILVGLFGAGAITGGVLMLAEQTKVMERAVSLGVVGCAAGLLLIGLAPGLAVALIGMFVTGIAFVNVTSNVLSSLQTNVDDRVRGRVMSLWMMIYGSMGPLGIIAYGGLAEAIDIQTVFVIGSAAMLAFLLVMSVRRRFRVLDGAAA